jgi:hypothetical protein
MHAVDHAHAANNRHAFHAVKPREYLPYGVSVFRLAVCKVTSQFAGLHEKPLSLCWENVQQYDKELIPAFLGKRSQRTDE